MDELGRLWPWLAFIAQLALLWWGATR